MPSLLPLTELATPKQDRPIRGAVRSTQGFKRLMPYHQYARNRAAIHQSEILDPQDWFLHRLNKIFLISCVWSVAFDPLFFYIPIIDGKNKCIKLDSTLKVIACVLRTLNDLFYLLRIILQFRTGFIAPSSRVFGQGELIKDPSAIAKRYVYSYFFVDLLAVLPFPQLSFFIPMVNGHVTLMGLLKVVIFSQYVPRFLRIYPLFKEVRRASGVITKTAWAGASSNLLVYMLFSHVVGAMLYTFAIDRQSKCWHEACLDKGCYHLSVYCKDLMFRRNRTFNEAHCSLVDPDQITSSTSFNFGMFYDAIQSKVVESNAFFPKLSYCFWWGLQNLSSLGQNLKPTAVTEENLFAAFICIFGLFLFSLLIGNMQQYLQSTTVREEKLRERRRDAERWMSDRLLPENLRSRIRKYNQYKWQKTRGFDEEVIIRNFPKDLRRDIKRHLCLSLLMRVPIFKHMDEKLMDSLCDRLKPVLYTKGNYIVREGDPVEEMLFITKGSLTMTTNDGRTGFFNSVSLIVDDFCGDELVTWALDRHSSSNLPISTRTVQSKTEVEAFALLPDDLKFVASEIHRLYSKHILRSYSPRWRTWAASFIQVEWRRYYRKKLEKRLQEAAYDALAEQGESSTSLGTAILVSRFATNALRSLRRNSLENDRPYQRKSLNLQKPTDPDFVSNDC
ncbi:cyclic nucleotide-gated ion channel 1-like [Silene latifolia]|uniref:cyclic nucleotide-gated ion channel 1-like n=1 Tax=Silene latifolia TaxID=37657 RepID=UPI003D777732